MKKLCSQAALYAFLWLVLVVMIVPFLWLILSSLRPNADLFSAPFAIPETLSLENYRAVLSGHPMFLYLFNTAAVAFLSCVLTIAVAVLASYALLHRFKLSPKVALLLSVGLFIPTNAFLVPYYTFINAVGLYDKIFGIVLVYAGINLPMSVMVIKGYMDTIPHDIMESAQIDGATTFQTLYKIIFPISVPGVVTACVFLVINTWNELLFANLLNQSDRSRTMQVAIRSFLTTFEANYAYAFAAMVLAILPTIAAYAILTDKIIAGMTAGAVKG